MGRRNMRQCNGSAVGLVQAHNVQAFRQAYEAATEDTFMFDGQVVFTSYAKYLLEFLDGKRRANAKEN